MYPKNHLWGFDYLNTIPDIQTQLINTHSLRINQLLEKIIDKILFRSQSNIRTELAAYKASTRYDLIYSVSGPFAMRRFFPGNAKVVSWVFKLYKDSRKIILNPYSTHNLKKHDGFFCLTSNCNNDFEMLSKSRFIPWSIDLDFFKPFTSSVNFSSNYFLATGKTNRDYNTLINASQNIDAEIRIIGPAKQKPENIPKNINWINTSTNPPDKAIDYSTLKKWYNNCIAVCIPLNGEADDTCGYTNMLEGMAMSKPILMTKSGCLHQNPEDGKYGYNIKPFDSLDWSQKMNILLNNNKLRNEYGFNGRKIVENDFSIKSFNENLLSFIRKII